MSKSNSHFFVVAFSALTFATTQFVSAADNPAPPPLPAGAPAVINSPKPADPAPAPKPPAGNIPTVATTPVPVPNLIWDSELKEHTATNGEAAANFTFHVTNVAPVEVIINSAQGSCGCTVAKMPQIPWHIASGSNGEMQVTVNLAGKMGTFTKQVTLNTTAGMKQVQVKVTMPPPAPAPATAQMSEADRIKNQQAATADRQAVFKGSCADCHAKPAFGKMGGEIFSAVCAVCHESKNRAAMVPDLHALKGTTNLDYWRHWIRNGRQGSMMPAFDSEQGGPLNPMQISSLAAYMEATFRPAIAPPQASPAAPPITNAAAKPTIIPTRDSK